MTVITNPDLLDYSRQLDAHIRKAPGTPLVYKIKAGDTLSQIILDNYGAAPGSDRYRQAEAQLLFLNRHVTDPNRIRMGQVLRLLPLTAVGSCPAPEGWSAQQIAAIAPTPTRHFLEPADPSYVERIGSHIPTDPAERDAFWALAWLQENYNWVAQPAGVGLTTFGLLTGPGNASLLQQVGTDYERYRRGELTKGQYDYRRRQSLKTFSQKVGPAERLILRGQRANQAVRISRKAGVPATARIDGTAGHLSKLSRFATRGGVVLAGAGVYMGCRQIGATANRHEKNEILVETAASTATGLGLSVVVAFALASTPVGWGVALILAAGTAAASYGTGKAATALWTASGSTIDLVGDTGIDQLCR